MQPKRQAARQPWKQTPKPQATEQQWKQVLVRCWHGEMDAGYDHRLRAATRTKEIKPGRRFFVSKAELYLQREPELEPLGLAAIDMRIDADGKHVAVISASEAEHCKGRAPKLPAPMDFCAEDSLRLQVRFYEPWFAEPTTSVERQLPQYCVLLYIMLDTKAK